VDYRIINSRLNLSPFIELHFLSTADDGRDVGVELVGVVVSAWSLSLSSLMPARISDMKSVLAAGLTELFVFLLIGTTAMVCMGWRLGTVEVAFRDAMSWMLKSMLLLFKVNVLEILLLLLFVNVF